MRSELDIQEIDNVMLFANYIFDGSVWEMYMAIMNGATLYIPSEEVIHDIGSMKKFVADNKITVSYFPPNYYEQGKFMLEKYVVTAGSAASMTAVESILKNSGYINSYGPTEATVCISNWICKKGEKPQKIVIGKPISNVFVHILQGENLCGIGVPGELCVSGDGLARGYLNRPELTEEKFVANPYGEGRMYRTGDLARWMPDGNIEYLGRIDEQVKIRGFRVELGEIESRIREIESITDCAVIAREDASGEKAIYAYYAGEEEVGIDRIREALEKTLPDYMVPSYMMQIESIPVTRNGKVDRRSLPEIEARSENAYVAPRNETEEIIADIYKSVLGLEKVGVFDNFFSIGGNSLKAMRISSILKGYKCNISIKDIYSSGTISEVAKKISLLETDSEVLNGKIQVCLFDILYETRVVFIME